MKTSKLIMKAAITAIAAVAVLISIIYFAYLSNKNFEETVVLQTQRELLTVAKAITTSIEEFFIEYSNTLALVSSNPLLQKGAHEKHRCYKPTCKSCPILKLYEVYKNKTDALTFMDANGIILHRSPFIKNRIGMDHTDKPGIAYVIKEHKPHVSEVFYNNLGNLAISILQPIFYKDEFAGIVRWMVETDTIARHFIEPARGTKNSFAWMFDNNNIIISHPRKELVGMSVLDVIKKAHKEKNKVFDESGIKEHIKEEHDYLNRLKVEEEGVGIFINCDTNENDIVAYRKVAAGNLILNLVITLPYSKIITPLHKHARELFGLAGFVIILLSAGGFVLLKNQKEKARFETESRYLKQIAYGAVALRESEAHLRTIFDAAENVSLIMTDLADTEAHILEFSRGAEHMFGYNRKEAIGKPVAMLHLPEDVLKFPAIINSMCQEKGGFTGELTLVRKSGEKFPAFFTTYPIFDSKGNMTATLGVSIDITRHKQDEKQIRLLSQQLIRAQEIERQMISRELHDSVAQELSAIKIGFDSIVYNYKKVPDEIRQMFLEYSKTLQNSIMAVRDLAYDLRPPGLDQFGIIQTIFNYCEDFSEKTGLHVDFSSAGMEDLKLDSDMKINLYRLVQEGLINIKKHAEASHVIIRLTAAFPNIILRIKDDGKGFDVKSRLISAQDEKRMGLRSMEERIGLLGGEMDIKSSPTEGTSIFIKFPY